MTECPNCGQQVPADERICPNCGFDTGESQAEDVRSLREAGRIHPGRRGPDDPDDFAGAGRGDDPEETPPGEGPVDPRETQGGL